MELYQDVHHCPMVFIRFNPDEYDDVKSCWAPDRFGVNVVKKSRAQEWEARLETLRREIEFWTDARNRTEKAVTIVRLFYDSQ